MLGFRLVCAPLMCLVAIMILLAFKGCSWFGLYVLLVVVADCVC